MKIILTSDHHLLKAIITNIIPLQLFLSKKNSIKLLNKKSPKY